MIAAGAWALPGYSVRSSQFSLLVYRNCNHGVLKRLASYRGTQKSLHDFARLRVERHPGLPETVWDPKVGLNQRFGKPRKIYTYGRHRRVVDIDSKRRAGKMWSLRHPNHRYSTGGKDDTNVQCTVSSPFCLPAKVF